MRKSGKTNTKAIQEKPKSGITLSKIAYDFKLLTDKLVSTHYDYLRLRLGEWKLPQAATDTEFFDSLSLDFYLVLLDAALEHNDVNVKNIDHRIKDGRILNAPENQTTFLHYFRLTNCNVGESAKRARITRVSFTTWCKDCAPFRNFVLDLKEAVIDKVEDALYENAVIAKNVKAQVAYLKGKRKEVWNTETFPAVNNTIELPKFIVIEPDGTKTNYGLPLDKED